MGTRIITGDCRSVLATLPAESVQLVVTSPPYNIGKEYEDDPDWADYLCGQRKAIGECARLLVPGGSLCWQTGFYVIKGSVVPLDCALWPLFLDVGLTLRGRIVWTFGHGLHCTHRFSGRHETVLWFTNGDGYKFNLDRVRVPSKYPNKRAYKGPRKGELSGNPLGKNPGDVWDISNVKANHSEKTDHPCQFPEELVERLVLALTDPGDMVLDPFAGSGTTGMVADRLNRDSILIELEPRYIAIAEARIRGPLFAETAA